jgi:membrane protease YdiL (CAAX protease family)
LWFAAARYSRLEPTSAHNLQLVSLFGVAGLISPVVVAFALILPSKDLRADVGSRFGSLGSVRPLYLLLTFLLLPASIVVAQLVSLGFGYSAEQFALSPVPAFTAGIFSPWFPLIAAPVLEELAWHSYGTDCLRRSMSLFTTSMVFAIIWALWHLPLAFIKGYYQNNLAESGMIYGINFAVSLFPFVLLMNWLYYKSGRSILVAIVFHLSANIANTIFATHPDSKIIQTGLLTILTVVLLASDRRFFFARSLEERPNTG